MIEKPIFIHLPARKGASAVEIFIKIIAEDEESLESKPYVFVFPGGPGTNHSHYTEYACLCTCSNVLFYDPRGCGLSGPDALENYTMDNYIEDIEHIRQKLKLDAIIVLGKSFGAMAALGYVLRYPSAVSKLVLAAGAPSFRFLETAKSNLLARGSKAQQAICEKLWKGEFRTQAELNNYLRLMAPLYSYKIKLAPHTADSLLAKTPYPLSVDWINRGFGGFLRQFDYEKSLHQIHCPTLILAAEEDWITDKQHSEAMARKIPNNTLHVFSKSGHMLEEDVPGPYFLAIENFVRTKEFTFY